MVDLNPNIHNLLRLARVVPSLLLHDKTLAWDLLKKVDVKSNIHDISFQNKWETLSHCRLVHYYVNNQQNKHSKNLRRSIKILLKQTHLLSDGARHVGNLVSMLTSYEVFMRVYKDTSKNESSPKRWGQTLVHTQSMVVMCNRVYVVHHDHKNIASYGSV